ncbi:hypothetical protein BJY01DRAFT_241325 [Aspergillus pseudoustus]|uniref:NADPH--cytochrome P450 reductase n=1 Tax=Aspergillus pseudoustus TaxID=1810923 RepID=A0ABR4IFS8_9EURO
MALFSGHDIPFSDRCSELHSILGTAEFLALCLLLLSGCLYLLSETQFKSKSIESQIAAAYAEADGVAESNDDGEKKSIPATMAKANKNCIILYGSQTGTAEDLASRLAQEGSSRFGLRAMAADLEDFHYNDLDQLSSETVVVFSLATYGEGEPTDSSVRFLKHLADGDADPLPNLCFAAFGLGNSAYEHYNAVVRTAVRALEQRGCRALCAHGEGDNGLETMEGDFLAWKELMWSEVAKHLGVTEQEQIFEPAFDLVQRADLSTESPMVYLGEPNAQHLVGKIIEPHGPRNPYLAPLVHSTELFRASDRNCLHLELDIQGSGLEYRTGDHIAVWPINSNVEIDRFLRVHGLAERRHEVIEIKPVDPQTKLPIPSPTTYETILRSYLEIGAGVSRDLVSLLAQFAPDEASRILMTRLGTDNGYFSKTVQEQFLNIAQVLELAAPNKTWPDIPFSIYIQRLLRLQPRYYSISSSSLAQPERVSVTAVVESRYFAPRDTYWKGVSTNYLLAVSQRHHHEEQNAALYALGAHRAQDVASSAPRIPVHLRASKFRLPEDPATPIVMVGPGTGVAPFRAFVQERAAQARAGVSVGRTLLFYGCRTKEEDYIYADDWEEFQHALSDQFQLVTAFSREGPRKAYVQDRLLEYAAEVNIILAAGGHFYICGDAAHMARAVNDSLAEIIAAQRGVELSEAQGALKKMRSSRQYQSSWLLIYTSRIVV